ncbi:MAG TPA: hypothetical protein VFY54_12215 [Rubrobacter sp.]|nr:hypothetical protein [Rubrobacter sp.]
MNDVERDEQLRKWVRAAPEELAQKYENELMWGVWLSPDNEDAPPPDALFGSEEEAREFVAWKSPRECDISPCVVGLEARNDYDIPEAAAKASSPHQCEEECCLPK